MILETALLLSLAAGDVEPSRTTLSLPVVALSSGGFTVQAERLSEGLSWSVAASLGARATAVGVGDYRGLSLGIGLEVRRWWHVGLLSASSFGGAVGGPFAWVRGDLAWVQLRRASGAVVGQTLEPGVSAGGGYRFLPAWRFELTPVIGLAAMPTINARLALTGGLTVGVTLP